MGGVYQRLVRDTSAPGENESDAILRVYNHPLCDDIDNYNASAYYEPSYYLAQVYRDMLKRNARHAFPNASGLRAKTAE